MQLDVRLPIGMMFGIVGILLSVYGMTSDPAIYQRSLGINVNLYWGLFLVAFAAVMLALAWRHKTTPATGTSPADPRAESESNRRRGNAH
jgi:hypothetical protein